MSRVHKKILGFFGLAFVIGTTVFAAGLPPVQDATATSGSSDIGVSVTVLTDSMAASIVSPVDGSTLYDGNDTKAVIDYHNTDVVYVYLQGPNDDAPFLVGTYTPVPGQDHGQFEMDLPLNDYGDYILTVKGEDGQGGAVDLDVTKFSYHAITGKDGGNGTIHVDLGPAVCRLQFVVYEQGDTAKTNPLINYMAENVTNLPGYPSFVDIAIPGFAELSGDKQYTVVVSAYDCSGGTDPMETIQIVANGVFNPPKTGSFSVFGLTISRTDYIVTGLITFFAVGIFALFLLRRKNQQKR